MYTVYRILVVEKIAKVAYNIVRHEDWVVLKAGQFKTEQEAKKFICSESMKKTDLPKYTVDIIDHDQKDEFIRKFCFEDDRYLLQRRFFMGYPDIDHIKKLLIASGVTVK